MARPKKGAHLVPTEKRILKAAETEFGKKGFERTRLEDIAKLADIRRPSLLYHFKSKDILYSAVVHRVFDSLRLSLLDRMRPGDFATQVENLTAAFSDFVQENSAFAPIVLREIINGLGPARDILINEMAPLLSVVETWLEQQGKETIPEGISVRYAILQIAANTLLHSASGDLSIPLWGPTDNSQQIARQIFLG
jgi:AcrR family transcriptional regulator